MLNLIVSFVVSFITIVWGAISYLKGPLVVGAVIGCVILAFPATSHAAVIQCNISGCPPVSWWDLLPWNKKAGIFLFFSGLIIGNVLMWHDRKVTAARVKEEEQEWLKKYHS